MSEFSIDTQRALQTVRAERPAPRGPVKAAGILSALCALFVAGPILFLADMPILGAASTGLLAGAVYFLRRRWRRWHQRFAGQTLGSDRVECLVHRSPAGLEVRYRCMAEQQDDEALLLEGFPRGMRIAAHLAPIHDPAFDAVSGFAGTPLQRALIGPALRMWAAQERVDFQLDEGRARVRLGARGLDADSPELPRVLSALEDFAARLREPHLPALSRLARDLEHPFDAARAFAALAAGWREQATDLATELQQVPLGAVLVDVATTGEGLLSPALTWPERSAIGRGVLGVSSVAIQRLLDEIATLIVEDDASAMAIVELAEAAQATAVDTRFAALRDDALQWIDASGGPACLAWLQARARRDGHEKPLLDRVSARLHETRTGLLSIDADAAHGGLSDVRVGKRALVSADSDPAS